MKEKKLLKIPPLPKVLRVQAIRASAATVYVTYRFKKLRRGSGSELLLLVKMKEKKLLKIQSLPKLGPSAACASYLQEQLSST